MGAIRYYFKSKSNSSRVSCISNKPQHSVWGFWTRCVILSTSPHPKFQTCYKSLPPACITILILQKPLDSLSWPCAVSAMPTLGRPGHFPIAAHAIGMRCTTRKKVLKIWKLLLQKGHDFLQLSNLSVPVTFLIGSSLPTLSLIS